MFLKLWLLSFSLQMMLLTSLIGDETFTAKDYAEFLTEKIKNGDKDLDNYYNRAIAYLSMKDIEKMNEDVLYLEKNEKRGWRYYHILATFEIFCGDDSDKGLEYFKKAYDLRKEYNDIGFQLAQMEIFYGNKSEGISLLLELEKGLEARLSRHQYYLAGGYYQLRDYQKALLKINEIKVVDFEVKKLKAKILVEMGNLKEGMHLLEKLLQEKVNTLEVKSILLRYKIKFYSLKNAHAFFNKIAFENKSDIPEFSNYYFKDEEDLDLLGRLIEFCMKRRCEDIPKFTKLLEERKYGDSRAGVLLEKMQKK